MALNSPFHRIPLQLFAEILSSYLTVNSVLALRLVRPQIRPIFGLYLVFLPDLQADLCPDI